MLFRSLVAGGPDGVAAGGGDFAHFEDGVVGGDMLKGHTWEVSLRMFKGRVMGGVLGVPPFAGEGVARGEV